MDRFCIERICSLGSKFFLSGEDPFPVVRLCTSKHELTKVVFPEKIEGGPFTLSVLLTVYNRPYSLILNVVMCKSHLNVVMCK